MTSINSIKQITKNIVLCSDGTGNSGGKGRDTNVWKIYLAVDRHDHEAKNSTERPQIAFYDDGVGTSDLRFFKIIGGAFGWGLGRNIRHLYTTLARNYARCDAIYLFGFSRGAYTVRSLAGMISEIGVIDASNLPPTVQLEDYVKKAYKAYRAKPPRHGKTKPVKDFKVDCEKNGVGLIDNTPIRFIGVWDTVDAVGVPFDELRDILSALAFRRRPHLQELTPNVEYAYHALAIDDERRTFAPEMWDEKKAGPNSEVEQVWFAGVHSNVGGGYPKEGLATVSLHWMINKARGKNNDGLRFVRDARDAAHDEANVHSKLYDSRAGLAAYYRYQPRNIAKLCKEAHCKKPLIDVTALDRIARATDGYAPTNLPVDCKVVGTDKDKDTVSTRIRDYQSKLDQSIQERRDAVEPVAAPRRSRTWLYYAFLLLSAFLASILVAFTFDWEWGKDASTSFSETLRPVLGWANPVAVRVVGFVGGILSGIVGIALPGFLEEPVRSLHEIPEVMTLITLLALVVLWRRQRVMKEMRALGSSMWRQVMAKTPGPGPAPPPSVSGTKS